MRLLSHRLSLFDTFRTWRVADLGGDVAAGLTLAAIAIPEQMATASLGGFTPQIGFFAFIAGSVAFAIFGTSRTLSMGADSTITPIFAGALSLLAVAGSPAYAALAATLALMVGAILVIGGLLRIGWIANLLSAPVTTGFLAGIAIHIAVSQLPALLGTPGAAGAFVDQIAALPAMALHANAYALAIGVGVFAVTLLAEKFSPRIPGALIALALATLITIAFHLESRGVSTLGVVLAQHPRLGLPQVATEDLADLASLALLIALIVMMQTAATARAFPPPDGEPANVDHDFIGAGAASLLAGLIGAFRWTPARRALPLRPRPAAVRNWRGFSPPASSRCWCSWAPACSPMSRMPRWPERFCSSPSASPARPSWRGSGIAPRWSFS